MKINFKNYISELNEAQMMTIQDLLNNFRKVFPYSDKDLRRKKVFVHLASWPNYPVYVVEKQITPGSILNLSTHSVNSLSLKTV